MVYRLWKDGFKKLVLEIEVSSNITEGDPTVMMTPGDEPLQAQPSPSTLPPPEAPTEPNKVQETPLLAMGQQKLEGASRPPLVVVQRSEQVSVAVKPSKR